MFASALTVCLPPGSAVGQEPTIPRPLPDAPGATAATPENLPLDIRSALGSQPTTGPQGALPVDLTSALRLAGATPLDIAAASARLRPASGLPLQAKAQKIPHLNGGFGYYRHDGHNRDLFTGKLFQEGSDAMLLGGGVAANYAIANAIFALLVAKSITCSRQIDVSPFK